jgi:hypothetical protein
MATALTACNDLLDPEIALGISVEEGETTYDYSRQRCIALYTFLPDGFNYIEGSMLAAASDEAEYTIEANSVHRFNSGSWNAVSNPDIASWTRNYDGIYAANLFLAKSDSINLDYLKYDPNKQSTYNTYLANTIRWKYEARFLRAYFYSELIKRYGGVPLIKEPVGITEDYVFQRDSLSKCIRFILSECDSAAANLPNRYTDPAELGRATKAAALGLKSRVLLYAAGELYNNTTWAGGYEYPEYISMADGKERQDRWEEAAIAAGEAINEWAGYWKLHAAGYADLFTGYGSVNIYESVEILFARRYDRDNSFERRSYPIGYNGATGGITPLGNLVDAYQMKDGSAFDWNNPEHAAAPYDNRDTRLSASILTNNTPFAGGPLQAGQTAREVQIWEGGLDGKPIPRATKTGYYLKKYVNPKLDLLKDGKTMRVWMIIRAPEIYLNYAEAANEAYGPNTEAPGATLTAVEACNQTRKRAGLPEVPSSVSYEDLKEIIRYERRVELAFEDHRFWDVRRWMIAPETLGVPAKAVQVIKNEDGSFTYTPYNLENRVWYDKMYFYPVPQRDLKIGNWPQNPLW